VLCEKCCTSCFFTSRTESAVRDNKNYFGNVYFRFVATYVQLVSLEVAAFKNTSYTSFYFTNRIKMTERAEGVMSVLSKRLVEE
jgi:hypothetical protein